MGWFDYVLLLGFAALVYLATRELNCWYWKINQMNESLKAMSVSLNQINQRIFEIADSMDVIDAPVKNPLKEKSKQALNDKIELD